MLDTLLSVEIASVGALRAAELASRPVEVSDRFDICPSTGQRLLTRFRRFTHNFHRKVD